MAISKSIDLYDLRRREVQAIGAAISTRDWWALEQAYNKIRDKLDQAGYSIGASPPEQAGAVSVGWRLVPETPTTLQMVKGNAMFHRGEVPINIYRAMVAAAPTPPDAVPAEIPAGMVAWHGGDRAPDDWDGGAVMTRDGSIYLHNNHPTGRWLHGSKRVKYYPHRTDLDIIAYTPKAPRETPPDAGSGSDGAGERV